MWMERESRTRSGVFARGMSCGLLPCPRIFRREMCRCRMVKMTCFISGKFIPPAVLWHSSHQRGNTGLLPYYWLLLLSCHFEKVMCSATFTDLFSKIFFSYLKWMHERCIWGLYFSSTWSRFKFFFSCTSAKLRRKGQRKGWRRSLVISKLKPSLGSPKQHSSCPEEWWCHSHSSQKAPNPSLTLGAAAWCHVDVKQAGTKANTQCLVCCGLAFLNFPFLMVPYQQQWEHPDNFCLYFFVCCEKAREALRLQSLPLLMCWVWFASE